MNKDIWKQAGKGGKAAWKGVSKTKRREAMRRLGIISATSRKLKKQAKLVDNDSTKQ